MAETIGIDSRRDRSSKSIAAFWNNFHFSGRVILCSVLFGMGLILIGGLIFIINTNDDTNAPYDNSPDGGPTKPPNNVVGPAVMCIGSFILIVGIIMCLFETQICRKKTGDSSPLIAEGVTNSNQNDLEPGAEPSPSHSHRLKNRKSPTSLKRSKTRHGKSHSKERKQLATPSPRSPPVTIETPKSFMTSSEETFLTPPNTFNGHTPLVHSNYRDAENQTSSSLMKSFTSSGPSWNQSTEFETPSTSFRDSSASLNSSIEVNENHEPVKKNTVDLMKLSINAGFLTPITLEEEKVKDMSAKIQNQKKELKDIQNKNESDLYISTEVNNKLPDIKILSETDPENVEVKINELQNKTFEENKKIDNVGTKNYLMESLTGPNTSTMIEGSKQAPELLVSQHLKSHYKDENISLEISIPVVNQNENKMSKSTVVVDKDQSSELKKYEREIDKIRQEILSDISEINENKEHHLTLDEESVNKNNSIKDEEIDLESNVSSNESVVSQDSILKKDVKHGICKEKKQLQESSTEDVKIIINVESINDVVSPKNDSVNLLSTESNLKDNQVPLCEPNNSQNEGKKSIAEIKELSKERNS